MAITINSIEKPGSAAWTFNSGTFGANSTPAPDSLYMMEMASGASVVNEGKDSGSHNSQTNSSDSAGVASTGDSYAKFVAANLDIIEFATTWGVTAYPFTMACIARSPVAATYALMTMADVSAGNIDYGMLLNQPNTGEFQIRRRNTDNITSSIDNLTDYGDDAWHLFAVVFASATAMHGYVDGIYGTGSATSVAFNANTDKGAIGVRNDVSAANHLEGDVTTAMVWKGTALSNNQLDDLWADPWGYLDAGGTSAFRQRLFL